MAPGPAARGVQPADIGDLVDVGEPRLAPDGKRAAVVVTTIDLDANAYRSRIWLVDLENGRPPVPLTPEGGRHVHPRWSPDGRQLAYLETCDDEDPVERRAVVWVVPNGGGEGREVLAWPDD